MNMMNEEQKVRLKILRDFLDQNRKAIKLDMGTFCAIPAENGDEWEMELTVEESKDMGLLDQGAQCGASMCMLGWAGTIFHDQIATDVEGNITDDWQDVGLKLFGTHNNHDTIGQYLFSSDWADSENTNTLDHAIYRINRVLGAEGTSGYDSIEDEWEDFREGVGDYEFDD